MTQPFKRVVPWFNRSEWFEVYRNVFTDDPNKQIDGLNRIQVWKCRTYDKLSISIELTRELIALKLKDEQNKISKLLSDHQMRLLYGMSITRFVNQLLESNQEKRFMIPLQKIAKQMKVPLWLVDLRHESTHQLLPSLQLLRAGLDEAITYLKKNYWMKMLYPFSLKKGLNYEKSNPDNNTNNYKASNNDERNTSFISNDEDEENDDDLMNTSLSSYKTYHISNKADDCGNAISDDMNDGDGTDDDNAIEYYDDYIMISVHKLLDYYIEFWEENVKSSAGRKMSFKIRDVINKLELFLHINKSVTMKSMLLHVNFLSSFHRTNNKAKMWLPVVRSFNACRLSSEFVEMICNELCDGDDDEEEEECLSSSAVYFIENSFKLHIDGRRLIRQILTNSTINHTTLKLFRCLLPHCRPYLFAKQKHHLTSLINIWNMTTTDKRDNNNDDYDDNNTDETKEMMNTDNNDETKFYNLKDFEEYLKANNDDNHMVNDEEDIEYEVIGESLNDDEHGDDDDHGENDYDYVVPTKKLKCTLECHQNFSLLSEFDIHKTPVGYSNGCLDLPVQLNNLPTLQ